MRSIKLAEKQHNLRNLMDAMTTRVCNTYDENSNPLKNIIEDAKSQYIQSCQASPKVFINTDEALVWIKGDVNKKSKHDLF